VVRAGNALERKKIQEGIMVDFGNRYEGGDQRGTGKVGLRKPQPQIEGKSSCAGYKSLETEDGGEVTSTYKPSGGR